MINNILYIPPLYGFKIYLIYIKCRNIKIVIMLIIRRCCDNQTVYPDWFKKNKAKYDELRLYSNFLY